jgi:hypothetical protein
MKIQTVHSNTTVTNASFDPNSSLENDGKARWAICNECYHQLTNLLRCSSIQGKLTILKAKGFGKILPETSIFEEISLVRGLSYEVSYKGLARKENTVVQISHWTKIGSTLPREPDEVQRGNYYRTALVTL